MIPFSINYNQVLELFDARIVYKSKFCVHFQIDHNQFVLYKPSAASPILCKHIPSGQHYPAYQVFYLCSPYLSLNHFFNATKLDALPEIEEINSITETISNNDLTRFIWGFVPFTDEVREQMTKENIYFYKVAKACEQHSDIKIPVFINKNHTLSFVYTSSPSANNNDFQICDFSHVSCQNRFAQINSMWTSPVFSHQLNALVSFSPSTFLQYVAQKSITDERAFVFSPDLSQRDIFEQFLSEFNYSSKSNYNSIFLLYSKDIQEIINNISFLCYLINYYCSIKVTFTILHTAIEFTFTYKNDDKLNLMFSNIFNKSLALLRQLLDITSTSEIDHDFFSLFKPCSAADSSRYSPDNVPESRMNDAYFSIPLKMECLLSFLNQLPFILSQTFSELNPHKFDIVLMDPFDFAQDDSNDLD